MTLIKYQKPFLNKFFEDEDDLMNPFQNMVKDFFGKETGSGLVNVSENENNYNLEFILPGYKKDDVKIEINNDILTVKANMNNKKEKKDDDYIRKEYVTSSFSRSFNLPEDASENIKAEMEDGILNVKVDKMKKEEKDNIKTINIE